MKEKTISLRPLKFKEAVADLLKVKPPEKTNKACACGCGGTPKGKNSRFLPGHDLRKAYNDAGGSSKGKGRQ